MFIESVLSTDGYIPTYQDAITGTWGDFSTVEFDKANIRRCLLNPDPTKRLNTSFEVNCNDYTSPKTIWQFQLNTDAYVSFVGELYNNSMFIHCYFTPTPSYTISQKRYSVAIIGVNSSYPKFKLALISDTARFGFLASQDNDPSYAFNSGFAFSMYDLANYGAFIAKIISPEYGEPSGVGGYGQNGGKKGTFDDSSDTISLPNVPSIGVTNVGFINVYKTTQNGLENFGAELFPDLVPVTPVTSGVAESIASLCENLVAVGDMFINSNLINYVIDCHVLPVTPEIGTSENIKVGFKSFSQTADKVISDYVTVDCGTLNIGEYYANFADYLPYTTFKLFLPFVGFVGVEPEFIQNGLINVTYRFNIIDGSFVAFVKSTSSKSNLEDSVIASYGGNCCVHIPITGLNYSSMISNVVGGVATLSGGAGAGAMISEIGNAVNTVSTSRPDMEQSNGYNATSSFLGVRTPYLMISRTVSNFSENYTNERGLPSNITTDFGELSGFTISNNVHLDGIVCTDAERSEIAQLLANGVIL